MPTPAFSTSDSLLFPLCVCYVMAKTCSFHVCSILLFSPSTSPSYSSGSRYAGRQLWSLASENIQVALIEKWTLSVYPPEFTAKLLGEMLCTCFCCCPQHPGPLHSCASYYYCTPKMSSRSLWPFCGCPWNSESTIFPSTFLFTRFSEMSASLASSSELTGSYLFFIFKKWRDEVHGLTSF